MNANNRTIAFQVPEELFGRLKDYLARNGLKQKDFILGLIERETPLPLISIPYPFKLKI